MVEDLPARIGLTERTWLISKVPAKVLFRHALMSTKGDHDRHVRSGSQAVPHRLKDQGQRAGPGTVRHHQANTLVLDLRSRNRCGDELGHLLFGKVLTHSTKNCSFALIADCSIDIPSGDRCHGATVPLGMAKAQEPEAAPGS